MFIIMIFTQSHRRGGRKIAGYGGRGAVPQDTGTLLRESPELLAEAFDLIDRDITDHVRDVDIVVDLPDVLAVARFHFDRGTGYEVIYSGACDRDDFDAAIAVVRLAHLIRWEPYGDNPSGYPQCRALFWELRGALH
ncbi:hypothetical protein QTQ03_01990 [Micromonospora sp. WMMA1363]|uniref:hypothetical protein n=1 Tax=Micromonospora sp. WMMA1363 TaxID=3053985 RepID=UPI00259CA3E8|nr:hypothetical protein [Micromonospora sp. WMMA1363]MDM4718420.1 hypothetical protein [Micromonospora sp. WMMA1363]